MEFNDLDQSRSIRMKLQFGTATHCSPMHLLFRRFDMDHGPLMASICTRLL